MKRYIFWALALMTLAACQPEKENIPPALTELIEQLRQAHAPDKRVALFNVTVERSGQQWLVTGETNLPEALQELEEGLKATGIKTQQEVRLLPDTSLQGKIYGVVRLSASNIRSEPRHSAELATQAMLGAPLRVYKETDGWFLVQTPDGYLSWLDDGGFTPMTKAAFGQWQSAPKVVFLPDMGFAYAAPATSAPIVSDLLAGNILQLAEKKEGFAEVRFPDGRIAFIPDNQVMDYKAWLDSRQPDAGHILETAYTFMGRPYLWGGTSGKAVDCSGFTKTVFFLNGLQLPRDASQQVHVGQAVETDTTLVNLQPADLLFFGRKATEELPEKITHVAIYLGDGKIIHSSGAVKVESMRRGEPGFTEYRLLSFVRARRMLSGIGENGVIPVAAAPLYQ
ncbi:MAG: C40 family peptidase [Phaeodactylibacter sp.]|nr:C40 family peptidase [Phaeodactylibacter sp.]MCB9302276.1 C40 family peptidase [Lewinellaceae bacterium]